MYKCELCFRKFKTMMGLNNHISLYHKKISRENYYKKFLMKENENICQMYEKLDSCKKYTKFTSISKGFQKYCSIKCASNDPEVRKKCKQTCLKKYNVENPSQFKEIQDKRKQTCLKNFGVEFPAQSKEIQNKQKQTCLKNFGVEYSMQSEEIKEKSKQTCLKNFGVEFPSQSEKIKEKYKQTCLKKYNVENPSQSKEIKEKKKQTCLENWNVKNPMQSEEIKEKHKQTCLKNFEVEYPMQSEEIKEKHKQTCLKNFNVEYPSQSKEIQERQKKTCLKNFGVEFPAQSKEIKEKTKQTCLKNFNVEYLMQSEEIKEKHKQTCLKNFGVENPSQSEEIKKKVKEKQRFNFLKKLNKYLEHLNLELLDKEYIHAGFEHSWKCKKCGNIFHKSYFNIYQGPHPCCQCFPKKNGTSIAEKEIYEFICDLIGKNKIGHNCYDIIKNPETNHSLELDIYIPDKKIAFEYNGLYWHSELRSSDPVNYHLQKTNLCLEQDIQLIHIFEDEWILKKEIVKSRIKQILNVNSDSERIHARKCEIKEIDPKTKNEFLEEFHIQGKDASVIKLGAFYNNKLFSVMTFSKGNISKGSKSKEGVWELNRFCSNSNFHIPGIAGKLLSHFKKNYEWKEIFSYADRRWSQGNLYYKLGFELDYITQPNYWYLKGFERIHRFNLRKRSYEPKDIPEWVLRQKEGYSRIWDCGNLKFVFK